MNVKGHSIKIPSSKQQVRREKIKELQKKERKNEGNSE